MFRDVRRFLHDRVCRGTKRLERGGLLIVKVDRLRRWCRDGGLLCIGDAATRDVGHQPRDSGRRRDSKYILTEPLREGRVDLNDLRAVQHRRKRPAHLTQRAQIFMHEHFFERVFNATKQMSPPLPVRCWKNFHCCAESRHEW
jgi:hypothetical protein